MGGSDDPKALIAARAALEIFPGARVNVGIGIATLVPRYLPADVDAWFHSENGFIGMGSQARDEERDEDLIDAGGRYVTTAKGASFFDSATSFAIIRGGHLDLSFLGAFEVDVAGNLANWRVPGRITPGIGGAMELAQKVPRVVVTSMHCAGEGSKLKTSCTLPLTAKAAVGLVITELGVLEPTGDSFRLLELAPGVTPQELVARTEAPLTGVEQASAWKVAGSRYN